VGKVIFALLTALIAWFLFKGFTKGLGKGSPRADADRAPDAPRASEGEPRQLPEKMVKCATCGVFMPESESLVVDGKVGCKDPALCAHRR
jgi:hypothetical protein